MSLLRALEADWVQLADADGRRGLWIRIDRGERPAIEFCAGREGDDEFLRLEVGQELSVRHLDEFSDMVDHVEWARETDGRLKEDEGAETMSNSAPSKRFPVLYDRRHCLKDFRHDIPWAMLVPHEAQARRNHGGQSLERLAERGGDRKSVV